MSNKKKKIIVISVIASLIALTSITIAVFTAKDEVINDFKVADIDVKVDEKWHEPDSWSGESLEKVAKVTNKLQTAEGKGTLHQNRRHRRVYEPLHLEKERAENLSGGASRGRAGMYLPLCGGFHLPGLVVVCVLGAPQGGCLGRRRRHHHLRLAQL